MAVHQKRKTEYYTFTPEHRRDFKIWLATNEISLRKFAKRCECSPQFISRVINGYQTVTETTKALFRKGGYIIL